MTIGITDTIIPLGSFILMRASDIGFSSGHDVTKAFFSDGSDGGTWRAIASSDMGALPLAGDLKGTTKDSFVANTRGQPIFESETYPNNDPTLVGSSLTEVINTAPCAVVFGLDSDGTSCLFVKGTGNTSDGYIAKISCTDITPTSYSATSLSRHIKNFPTLSSFQELIVGDGFIWATDGSSLYKIETVGDFAYTTFPIANATIQEATLAYDAVHHVIWLVATISIDSNYTHLFKFNIDSSTFTDFGSMPDIGFLSTTIGGGYLWASVHIVSLDVKGLLKIDTATGAVVGSPAQSSFAGWHAVRPIYDNVNNKVYVPYVSPALIDKFDGATCTLESTYDGTLDGYLGFGSGTFKASTSQIILACSFVPSIFDIVAGFDVTAGSPPVANWCRRIPSRSNTMIPWGGVHNFTVSGVDYLAICDIGYDRVHIKSTSNLYDICVSPLQFVKIDPIVAGDVQGTASNNFVRCVRGQTILEMETVIGNDESLLGGALTEVNDFFPTTILFGNDANLNQCMYILGSGARYLAGYIAQIQTSSIDITSAVRNIKKVYGIAGRSEMQFGGGFSYVASTNGLYQIDFADTAAYDPYTGTLYPNNYYPHFLISGIVERTICYSSFSNAIYFFYAYAGVYGFARFDIDTKLYTALGGNFIDASTVLSMTASADGQSFWVLYNSIANGAPSLTKFDLDGNASAAVVISNPIGWVGLRPIYDSTHNKVFVTYIAPALIDQFDATTGALDGTFDGTSSYSGFGTGTFSSVSNQLVVSAAANAYAATRTLVCIFDITGSNPAMSTVFPIPIIDDTTAITIGGICVDPITGWIMVADCNHDRVYTYNSSVLLADICVSPLQFIKSIPTTLHGDLQSTTKDSFVAGVRGQPIFESEVLPDGRYLGGSLTEVMDFGPSALVTGTDSNGNNCVFVKGAGLTSYGYVGKVTGIASSDLINSVHRHIQPLPLQNNVYEIQVCGGYTWFVYNGHILTRAATTGDFAQTQFISTSFLISSILETTLTAVGNVIRFWCLTSLDAYYHLVAFDTVTHVFTNQCSFDDAHDIFSMSYASGSNQLWVLYISNANAGATCLSHFDLTGAQVGSAAPISNPSSLVATRPIHDATHNKVYVLYAAIGCIDKFDGTTGDFDNTFDGTATFAGFSAAVFNPTNNTLCVAGKLIAGSNFDQLCWFTVDATTDPPNFSGYQQMHTSGSLSTIGWSGIAFDTPSNYIVVADASYDKLLCYTNTTYTFTVSLSPLHYIKQATVTFAGDLSGTNTSQTVVKINGTSVPATPSQYDVLTATSSTTAAWSLITNDNVAIGAAIDGAKVTPDFGAQNVVTTGSGTFGSFRDTSLGVGVGHLDASGNLSSSTIVNTDVAVGAAIDGAKVTPDFGAQNVVTTGSGTFGSIRDTSLGVGVGHLDASGNLSSSTIVDADIAVDANIAASKIVPLAGDTAGLINNNYVNGVGGRPYLPNGNGQAIIEQLDFNAAEIVVVPNISGISTLYMRGAGTANGVGYLARYDLETGIRRIVAYPKWQSSCLVYGNGFLWSIYNKNIVKIDPSTLEIIDGVQTPSNEYINDKTLVYLPASNSLFCTTTGGSPSAYLFNVITRTYTHFTTLTGVTATFSAALCGAYVCLIVTHTGTKLLRLDPVTCVPVDAGSSLTAITDIRPTYCSTENVVAVCYNTGIVNNIQTFDVATGLLVGTPSTTPALQTMTCTYLGTNQLMIVATDEADTMCSRYLISNLTSEVPTVTPDGNFSNYNRPTLVDGVPAPWVGWQSAALCMGLGLAPIFCVGDMVYDRLDSIYTATNIQAFFWSLAPGLTLGDVTWVNSTLFTNAAAAGQVPVSATNNTATWRSLTNNDIPDAAARIVADMTARDNIPSSLRTDGMMVWVQSTEQMWQLIEGITNADWFLITDPTTQTVIQSNIIWGINSNTPIVKSSKFRNATTTAATLTAASFALSTSCLSKVTVEVGAWQSGGPDGADFTLTGCWYRSGAGAPVQVGAPSVVTSSPNLIGTAWTAVLFLSGNNVLVRVTGDTGKTINWQGVYNVRETS